MPNDATSTPQGDSPPPRLAYACVLPAFAQRPRGTLPSRSASSCLPAAGAVDITRRIVGQRMSQNIGQQILIETRWRGRQYRHRHRREVRAGRLYGALYLVLALSSTRRYSPSCRSSVERISRRSRSSRHSANCGCAPGVPANNIKELIALAKETRDAQLRFSGTGSPGHLAGEL
jgi:hypothetical protein